jgi:hypothetical protein
MATSLDKHCLLGVRRIFACPLLRARRDGRYDRANEVIE